MSKKNIVIIGSGPMGLAAAHELLKFGHHVTIFEQDDRIGGMSASFDFNGERVERFYHFICKPDQPLFDLLDELRLTHTLQWKTTRMGFFYHGKLYPWGSPTGLLKFSAINFFTKIRYGLMIRRAIQGKNLHALDAIGVTDWLTKNIGEKGYDVLWKNLFFYKFYQYQHELSAAWLCARIRRVGLSRKNIFKESLGHLIGGSDVLLSALEKKILEAGGIIQLKSCVDKIVLTADSVVGVNVNGRHYSCDTVISTVPLPIFSKLTPDLPVDEAEKIAAIRYVGVICIVFKLKEPLTKNFWLNINDPGLEIPGIIEYTNLNPNYKHKLVYVPYYMPHDHPKYHWEDQQFITEIAEYFKKINNDFSMEWIIDTHVARYSYAQPVCPPGFFEKLPPLKSKCRGLYMADTTYYYPEDRSIAESIQLGIRLAREVHSCRTIIHTLPHTVI